MTKSEFLYAFIQAIAELNHELGGLSSHYLKLDRVFLLAQSFRIILSDMPTDPQENKIVEGIRESARLASGRDPTPIDNLSMVYFAEKAWEYYHDHQAKLVASLATHDV